MIFEKIAIIGAGEWGRALSFLISKKVKDVVLWHRPTKNVLELPENVRCTHDKSQITGAQGVLFCVPSQYIRSVSSECASFIKKGTIVLNCAKGIEQKTLLLMTEILQQTVPECLYGVLSGPNFAREVLHGLPAAATIALEGKNNLPIAQDMCKTFESPMFRLYWGSDPIGVQIAGAVKNVLAIGCGIITGQGLGENARAAVLARGLSEMIKIGVNKGASLETFIGLTGVGDMILTCTSFQSRNFQYGYQLGKNTKKDSENNCQTTEGIVNAQSILALAQSLKVEIPLIEAIHDIINHQLPLLEAVKKLMGRPLSAE